MLMTQKPVIYEVSRDFISQLDKSK